MQVSAVRRSATLRGFVFQGIPDNSAFFIVRMMPIISLPNISFGKIVLRVADGGFKKGEFILT